MHLRKQIEEMLKAGKLSHRIKEIKQNNGKKQPKSFSPNLEIFFPPLGEDEGTEGPMIIEAEIGGHCVHRIRPGVRKLQAVPSTAHGMLKILVEGGVITQKSSKLVSLECAMVSGPGDTPSAVKPIIKERVKVAINSKYLEQTVRQKKRGQAADRNQAIQEEVGKLMGAGIMREDGYPLPKIDWKVESLCGFPFKCFLDAYKGYRQIQMATKDEEKTTFITSHGIFCYTKMPFGLRNAGATYQSLVDKTFHKQIGRNLEVYVDDLVIKIHTEDGIVRDIEETFRTLRDINMKLNPKKCAFVVKEGMFLGYKVNAKGLKVCPDKVDAVLSLPSPTCLKDVQKLNGKLASLNRALRGPELHYTSMEKLVLALVHAIKHLKRPRVSVKGQILADFIVERPEEDTPNTPMEEEGKLPELWILFKKGSSCTDGSRVGLILTNPWIEFTYALRFRFDATNNKTEYEALIAGLRIAKQMGVKNLLATVDSCLVANQVNGTYVAKEADMIRYLEKVKALTGSFRAFSIKQIFKSENKDADALSKIASTSLAHLSKQVLVEELKEKSIGKIEILAVVEEEGDTWMTPLFKYLAEGTLPADVKKARAIRRKSWFRLPRKIISDNGKQFQDDPFKDWCEKLCIRQHFASVKHPQTSGLVERANRSLGEGIKASNRDTPFSLTYETEAVIPAEIGIPTLRTVKVKLVGNNEALEINLDLLEERREEAAIREAKSKAKMEKYYNSKVQNTSFKLRDLIYRNNDASRAEDTGKLGPKWEGPYKVTEALEKGAYKLKDRDGKQLPRTWNISNLKKCYIHKM
nr:hypothetical protein [Tanacetum cinerariifolium]